MSKRKKSRSEVCITADRWGDAAKNLPFVVSCMAMQNRDARVADPRSARRPNLHPRNDAAERPRVNSWRTLWLQPPIVYTFIVDSSPLNTPRWCTERWNTSQYRCRAFPSEPLSESPVIYMRVPVRANIHHRSVCAFRSFGKDRPIGERGLEDAARVPRRT